MLQDLQNINTGRIFESLLKKFTQTNKKNRNYFFIVNVKQKV